jgi:hypothetical protein
MATSRIQFVDSISDTATLRLDLDAAPWRVLQAGTDTPPPPLRRVVSQSFLTDGATIPQTAYDNRIITLALQVSSKNPDVVATQLQKLNRELNRDQNILRWQPDTSQPAQYFRTFRAPDYDPNMDYGVGTHGVVVAIPAEPFGYGPMQTLGTFTINNDPAAGSNPLYFDTSAVIGDVETPLYITHTTNFAGFTALLAVRRRGTPSAGVYVVQAEAMTQGTDTATAAGGATFSGSGSNESTTTFSSVSDYADRLTAILPSNTASADLRGTYRVFARQKKSASGSVMWQHLRLAGNIDNPTNIVPDSTAFMHNDLGLIQIPSGVNAPSDGYGPALGAIGVSCVLRATRTSGSGSLQTDYFLLAPADQEMAIVDWPGTPGSTTWVYDGPNDECYWRGSSPVNYALSASGGSAPIYRGGLPLVSPNQANRVFFVKLDGAVSDQTSITVSYWPRYLLMRPVAT